MQQNKSMFASLTQVLKFNDGDISYLKIFQDLNIKPGMFTSQGAGKCDQSRIRLSAKKAMETEKVKKNIEALDTAQTPQPEICIQKQLLVFNKIIM